MINKAKVANNHFNLGDSFYHIATPAKFPRHILRFRNDRAAKLLDLDQLNDNEWIKYFGQFDYYILYLMNLESNLLIYLSILLKI